MSPATLHALAPAPGLPPARIASVPPERRGIPRDGVRLLVAEPAGIRHRVFRDLPLLLEPGDLLVVNTSATLPAAVPAARAGELVPLHVSAELEDGTWVVELRRGDGAGPLLDGRGGERLGLPGELTLSLIEPYPDIAADTSRLWRAAPWRPVAVADYLARHGRPISYAHQAEVPTLDELQNAYALQPGSAEMASAGRPLTAEVLTRLVAHGVTLAPIVLHAGVSSPERDEPPAPEPFAVGADTARLVNSAREAGRRVIAVGTTVVRALESVVGADGTVAPGRGWTDLVLGPERPVRAVDGLVTGLHAPEASHIRLLEAVAGADLVDAAYAAAAAGDYLWHEFGDAMLFLPAR